VRPDHVRITPITDAAVVDLDGDPAAVAAARDTIRLAFISAMQRLPARQRAALVLCDVLRWPASEAAELLETSTASINSALQRARAGLAQAPSAAVTEPLSAEQRDLLARYMDAFERYDMDALAFAQYRVDPSGGHTPWALQVLELRGDRIEAVHSFLDTEAFERCGFPPHLAPDHEPRPPKL
jgi:RNA polymerase sigma-70 factor (ECF subfamily)